MECMLFVKFSAQPICPFPFGDGDDDDESDSRHLLDRHGQRDTVLCHKHAFFFHLIFLIPLRVLLWNNDTLE